MFQKLINTISTAVVDIIKFRFLNKKTPPGLLLVLVGGVFFGHLGENELNLIMLLLSNVDLSWTYIYITVINLFVLFLIAMGAWLIFAKVKKITK